MHFLLEKSKRKMCISVIFVLVGLLSVQAIAGCSDYGSCTGCISVGCAWFSGPGNAEGMCASASSSIYGSARITSSAYCSCYSITTNSLSSSGRCANDPKCKWCYDEVEMANGDDDYPHCQPASVSCSAEA